MRFPVRTTAAALLAAGGVSLAGLGFIRGHEGEVLQAYPDPAHGWEVPTICVGSTRGVQRGMRATPEECLERLQEDSRDAGRAVARLIQPSLTQGQFDALVSFTFNVGEGALARSTLRRLLNSADSRLECMRAAAEFSRWVYAGGKRLRGLERRRADERRMFEQGCQHWPESPPEAVLRPAQGIRRNRNRVCFS